MMSSAISFLLHIHPLRPPHKLEAYVIHGTAAVWSTHVRKPDGELSKVHWQLSNILRH